MHEHHEPNTSVRTLRAVACGPKGVTPDGDHAADLIRLLGASETELHGLDNMSVTVRRLRSGEILYHEGAVAHSLYVVRAGTFKSFSTAEDGYEQVLGFSGRSDLLGFDAVCMGQHPTACAALEDASVYAVPVSKFMTLDRQSPSMHRAMTMAVSRTLRQRSELVDVMAAVAAEVRMARFILQWSNRMRECGQSALRFRLRMCRRDIASHLGVAHETVSRSLNALVRWGLLSVANREVAILNFDGLRALARNTRRHVDEISGAAAAGSSETVVNSVFSAAVSRPRPAAEASAQG